MMHNYLITFEDTTHDCGETEVMAPSIKSACRKVRKFLRSQGMHQQCIWNVYELSADHRIWKIVYGPAGPGGFWWRYADADPMQDLIVKMAHRSELFAALTHS